MNDELFERINAIDPDAGGAPVIPHDGPMARALLEDIMSIDTDTRPARASGRSRHRRAGLVAGGVGAAVAAAAAIAIGVGGLGSPAADGPVPDTTPAPDTTLVPDTTPVTSLAVSLAASDPMAMCLQIGEYQPVPTASAFSGRVVAVADGTVTIDVDRWYQGGEADQVVVTASDSGMSETGIEGTALVEGAELLVTVVDGQVQTCGISAGASAELEAFYETWYG